MQEVTSVGFIALRRGLSVWGLLRGGLRISPEKEGAVVRKTYGGLWVIPRRGLRGWTHKEERAGGWRTDQPF